MQTYIEKLKGVGLEYKPPELNKQKETEKLEIQNPCVVCCVTMGKEPHVGHLLLFTMAEQIESGVGSKLPVFLINNNTGPRAAGALVNIANSFGLSLKEAAEAMDDRVFEAETVVSAYRSRSDTSSEIEQAKQVLELGDYDIFAVIGQETEDVLRGAGYNIQVVSEAKLIRMSGGKTKNLNPTWEETGFTPFWGEKRIVVLEKAGSLTATGALLTSVRELAEGVDSDLTIIVDSQPDVGDVAFVQKMIETSGGVQVLGAGVGFGGEIASGTKGEAMTIKELFYKFCKLRPERNLKQAAMFLMLTRPLHYSSKSQSLGESFYNFKDNHEILMTLVECSDGVEQFKDNLILGLETLSGKVSEKSKASHPAAQKFLEFLPKKSMALLAGEPERVLSESKKVVAGVRQNYYFGYLKSLIITMQNILSLNLEEFLTIGEMVRYCLSKIGI